MPESTMGPRYVGAKDVSAVTGLGRSTVYVLLKTGQIRSVWFGARRLIPVEELNRFVESLAQAQ
jgi:excisionase family DNA binding protein